MTVIPVNFQHLPNQRNRTSQINTRIYGIECEKRDKTVIFSYDMIIYTENLAESVNELLKPYRV